MLKSSLLPVTHKRKPYTTDLSRLPTLMEKRSLRITYRGNARTDEGNGGLFCRNLGYIGGGCCDCDCDTSAGMSVCSQSRGDGRANDSSNRRKEDNRLRGCWGFFDSIGSGSANAIWNRSSRYFG